MRKTLREKEFRRKIIGYLYEEEALLQERIHRNTLKIEEDRKRLRELRAEMEKIRGGAL